MSAEVIDLPFAEAVDGYGRSILIEIIVIPRDWLGCNRSQQIAPLAGLKGAACLIPDGMRIAANRIIFAHPDSGGAA
ncbi:hypothetical protein D3C73_1493910 [compost metagenome]